MRAIVESYPTEYVDGQACCYTVVYLSKEILKLRTNVEVAGEELNPTWGFHRVYHKSRSEYLEREGYRARFVYLPSDPDAREEFIQQVKQAIAAQEEKLQEQTSLSYKEWHLG